MPIALAFFVHYAYLILFLWVLVEQIGIPAAQPAGVADGRNAERHPPNSSPAGVDSGFGCLHGRRFDVVLSWAQVWRQCVEANLQAVV